MVGWIRLRVRGARGTTIPLRYAEVLNPDGTLYTENLRSARNTDHCTLEGDGGHCMTFRDFDENLWLSLHRPNSTPDERPIFLPLEDGKLIVTP